MSDQEVLLRHEAAGVVTLTLNRPAQFNALSEELLAALQAELDAIAASLQQDDSIRCLVIAASGKAFSAGHDLKEMQANRDKTYYQDLFRRCSEVMQALPRLPVPVIARVQGMATAAGCQMIAACDLAVAADSATFAVSGINVGLFCSTPAVALSRKVPRAQAFEMLVTGRFIDCAEAREIGLINRISTVEGLDDAVRELTDAISAKSPLAIRTGKELFYRQLGMGLAEAYALAGETMAGNMMADDVAEGIDAFLTKRPPTWTGR
jgi:enoyl-CoA hydratase/carnithine racemase